MPASMARSPVSPKPSTSCGGAGTRAARKGAIPYRPTDRRSASRHDRVLVGALRQVRHRVEAGRQAGEPDAGRVPLQRLDQRGPPPRVHPAHLAQVPVVASRPEQGGQRELVQTRGAAVRQQLLLGDRAGQRRRGEDPAQPDRGRQRLADRAEGEHPVRGDALQHADRLAVVAELRVVVVLDDVAVVTAGPLHQRVPPRRRQHHPGGRLVRRGHHHGAGPAGRQRGHVDPEVVDRHPDRLARPPGQPNAPRCSSRRRRSRGPRRPPARRRAGSAPAGPG